MRWPEEENAPPAGDTPRKLYRLTAEKVADIIAVRSLPAIELYLAENYFYDCYFFPNRYSILKYLDRLRSWFWKESYPWLGPDRSSLRLLVNKAMSEVLDYHFEVTKGPRDQQLFVLFLFQLLFQYEAGKLTSGRIYGVDHLCRNLEFFLQHMGPFAVTSLYVTKLKFYEREPIALLLKQTPHLKFIRLFNSMSGDVALESLRDHCPNIEDVEVAVDFGGAVHSAIEDDLFKIFFRTLNKKQLLARMAKQQNVELTFPNLKAVDFRSLKQFEGPDFNHLIFFLNIYYPRLKCKWFYSIGDTTLLPSILDSGILCPSFVRGHENLQWDGIALHMMEEDEDNFPPEDSLVPLLLKANYIYLYYNLQEFPGRPNFIEDVMRIFECQSLKIEYSSKGMQGLITAFGQVCPTLKELYLDGHLIKRQDGDHLCTILNKCVNLSVLALKFDLVFSPLWPKLNEFRQLEVLSLKIHNFPSWQDFPVTVDRGNAFNPSLKVLTHEYIEHHAVIFDLPGYARDADQILLHRQMRDILPRSVYYLNSNRHRSHNDASIYGSSTSNRMENQVGGGVSRRTPESPDLLRHFIFGPGPLKYNIPMSSTNMFGFGVLEYKSLKGSCHRDPAKCVYRKPAFTFYCNDDYEYGSHRSGIVNYRTPFQSGLPYGQLSAMYGGRFSDDGKYTAPKYMGFFNYHETTYSHVRFDIRKKLMDNHYMQSQENIIPQWRLDMDFDAPLSLLGSLLYASPNLKVLEIPDLRYTDVGILFNHPEIARNLTKVHTLHLSSQYTRPLALSAAKFPSLRLIRVDPTYGIDNFLRFKRSLRWTNLEVEIGKSLVYPGSDSVER